MKTDSQGLTDSSDSSVQKRKAGEYGLRFLPSIGEDMLAPDLVAGLPVEWARTHAMLPVRIEGRVCVATADPDKVSEQQYLSLLIGKDLEPVLAPRTAILKSIEQCYYRREHSPLQFIEGLQNGNAGPTKGVSMAEDLLHVTENAPVTQLINLILLEAVKRGASDIHFEPFEDRLRVRYRVDGVLFEQTSPPKHMEEPLVSRLKVMAKMDIAERRLPQDGMARVRVGDRELDIRVATIPVAEGERVVLRILDRDAALLPMESLGLSAHTFGDFQRLLSAPHGMIIVCGPTGSGKTTTLYAALSRLDSSRQNIITIEDPIEYQIPNIGQIQVKPKIGLTFATGLRHILRQDPDIVLVGEMRDLETAEIAIRASLTGHLVFTTLHANDAPGVVVRMVDMGVENYLVASCLRAALSQRLVRRLCPQCRDATVPSDAQLKSLGLPPERIRGRTTWEPRGCSECLEGYCGRVGLFELMAMDAETRDVIRSGSAGGEQLRKFAESRGMKSLLDDGIEKVLAGTTSLSELRTVLT